MTDLECEFVGGPADGLVYAIWPGTDGLPITPFLVPTLTPNVAVWVKEDELFPPQPVPIQAFMYHRDSISDTTHRWVYRLRLSLQGGR